MYKADMEKGNGTKIQRAKVRELIQTADEKSTELMREHFKLLTRAELMFADRS
jgi:hypothetical protein